MSKRKRWVWRVYTWHSAVGRYVWVQASGERQAKALVKDACEQSIPCYAELLPWSMREKYP